MSTDVLRRAAALMRERAEATEATRGGEWHTVLNLLNHDGHSDADAAHIASWHPAVALAVADWLDDLAVGWPWDDDEVHDPDGNVITLGESIDSHALAVARAYLGEQS